MENITIKIVTSIFQNGVRACLGYGPCPYLSATLAFWWPEVHPCMHGLGGGEGSRSENQKTKMTASIFQNGVRGCLGYGPCPYLSSPLAFLWPEACPCMHGLGGGEGSRSEDQKTKMTASIFQNGVRGCLGYGRCPYLSDSLAFWCPEACPCMHGLGGGEGSRSEDQKTKMTASIFPKGCQRLPGVWALPMPERDSDVLVP